MERKNVTAKNISELKEGLSWHMKSLELEQESLKRFGEKERI